MEHFDTPEMGATVKKPRRGAENLSKATQNANKHFQEFKHFSRSHEKETLPAKLKNINGSKPRVQGAVGGAGSLALERLLDIAGPEWSEEEEEDR